jgi:hypothetical protein
MHLDKGEGSEEIMADFCPALISVKFVNFAENFILCQFFLLGFV